MSVGAMSCLARNFNFLIVQWKWEYVWQTAVSNSNSWNSKFHKSGNLQKYNITYAISRDKTQNMDYISVTSAGYTRLIVDLVWPDL